MSRERVVVTSSSLKYPQVYYSVLKAAKVGHGMIVNAGMTVKVALQELQNGNWVEIDSIESSPKAIAQEKKRNAENV